MFTGPRAVRIAASLVLTLSGGCASSGTSDRAAEADPAPLLGAWRSHIQFSSGDFATIHDLEFLYAFSGGPDGGSLVESSNYDANPPVPPAYGAWRRSGPRRYEARYLFYTTRPPASLDAVTRGGGWAPAGRGELTEQIILADDGRTFSSNLQLNLFDAAGQPIPGGGEATGAGERIELEH
jgi:hypothetical protein